MKIAIIGGGIMGLTTGLALLRKGIDFTIYERASEINEVGAGIWLQPYATQVMGHLSFLSCFTKLFVACFGVHPSGMLNR